ncbi:hypothetical protein ACFFQF_18555 [Haladaptatus pallidirubidus]|uniref:SnoaL-like domain-containing protein n=1 Tax=Haladaptatus pallidirubidus TaxID=1008152 RepID=A0AAV3US90_9EURY|nr:hypothetical protein [Haladaptatus pallidirubidus]
MADVSIVELETEDDWLHGLPVLKQLRTHLTKTLLLDRHTEMQAEGYRQFAATVDDSTNLFYDGISEITVENIILHGDMAAVNGVITPDNGDTHAFCEVFKFEGHMKDANIKSIDSYVVEMV